MAEMIGKTKSWLTWLAGALLALVFGGAGCGRSEPPVTKYGAPPMRPPTAPPQPPGQPTPAAVPAQSAAELEDSPDWKVITGAWDFAMPFARSGKSTTAQRKEIDAKLAAAREAGTRLVAAGLLSAKETELLNTEAEKAVKDIRRDPPTDPVGKCYDMAYVQPERLSLQAIATRLPAIEALVKAGKVHPAAIKKVLEAIEADLATIADEKRRAELGDRTPKAEADKLRAELSLQVARIKAGLPLQTRPPTRMCYEVQMLPEPKIQSARELDERLAMIERAERAGRLAAPAAEKARTRILADRAEVD